MLDLVALYGQTMKSSNSQGHIMLQSYALVRLREQREFSWQIEKIKFLLSQNLWLLN